MAVSALAFLSCQHWAGGLVAWCVWFVWSLRKGNGEIPKPPFWQAWIVVLFALLASTALSGNPSGLQWAGLLQWLSLLGGAWALQDLLRREPNFSAPLLTGLLVAGCVDAVRWTWDLIRDHMAWWTLRTEGLPLFPFRVRLFGSHGSTQAAAWLAGLLLLALSVQGAALIPRRARWGWWALLLSWSILLGFCDSRLAFAGFLVGLVVRDLSAQERGPCAWLALIPAVVWWVRDLVHPSRVSTGGGVGSGFETMVVVLLLLLLRRVQRAWMPGPPLLGKPLLVLLAVSALLPVAIPTVFAGGAGVSHWNAIATGRLDFWSVAFESWKAHPLLGVGPWTYVHSYSRGIDWTFGFLAMHPHNAFLEMLSAGGIVLVLAFLAILASVFLHLGKAGVEVLPAWSFPAFICLAVGMTFDSPMSSPQVMALQIVCAACLLGACRDPGRARVPRTAVLLPLLILVPLSFVWERQVSKAPLLEAGGLLARSQWDAAAEMILTGSKGVPLDPQWSRNVLMARTMLAASPESLKALQPDWSEQVRREPGFLPNTVHQRWVAWRLAPTKTKAESLLTALERLGHSNEGLPAMGVVSPRWATSYPSDRPEYWSMRLDASQRKGDIRQTRWIEAWFRHRFPTGVVGHGRRLSATGARGVAESQLYGSPGTRWLLIPQVASPQLRLH